MAKKRIPTHKIMSVAEELSVDDQLADHLNHAETHLIAAVELFAKKIKPERSVGYLERLTRAQETVTTLLREELIRIRGPIKTTTSVRKSRKTK